MVHNKIVLFLPLAAAGLFCGTTEIFIFPELGHIVDVRYESTYGNVYAIADFALCLGFGVGTIICYQNYDFIGEKGYEGANVRYFYQRYWFTSCIHV